MPDASIQWPYGLKGSPVDFTGATAKRLLALPLVVLLGEKDVESNYELRHTKEADAQGGWPTNTAGAFVLCCHVCASHAVSDGFHATATGSVLFGNVCAYHAREDGLWASHCQQCVGKCGGSGVSHISGGESMFTRAEPQTITTARPSTPHLPTQPSLLCVCVCRSLLLQASIGLREGMHSCSPASRLPSSLVYHATGACRLYQMLVTRTHRWWLQPPK